jgi:hypothetical protein
LLGNLDHWSEMRLLPKRVVLILGSLATVALLLGLLAGPAAAVAVTSPTCERGDVAICIYWGQSYNNSHTASFGNVSNFPTSSCGIYKYLSSGTGQGQCLGNNNGSVLNLSVQCASLYYDPNYGGISFTLRPGAGAAGPQLDALLNNLRSVKFHAC